MNQIKFVVDNKEVTPIPVAVNVKQHCSHMVSVLNLMPLELQDAVSVLLGVIENMRTEIADLKAKNDEMVRKYGNNSTD